MSVFSNTSSDTYQASGLRSSGFRNLVSAVMREIRLRRALRDVASMDDAMLHDIGLSPGSVEDAVRCGRR